MSSFQPNEGREDVNNSSEFSTNMVWKTCQDLIDWVQTKGRSLGYIIVIRRKKIRPSGLLTKVTLVCDRGGIYKTKKISTRKTGTKKIDCPFELKGKYSKLHDFWTLSVVCGIHNHGHAEDMEGHAMAMRLTGNELRLVADLSAKNVKPHDILSTMKEQNPENVSTLQTIYNAKKKIKKTNQAGMTQMQGLLSSLDEEGYIFFYRTNSMSNELEDIFFIHPKSLDIWQAFPQVMLMDATYKTNKYKMPLLEIVGFSSTWKTFCIAFVFMHEENTSSYTWALNHLKSTMGGSLCPQVIVTDRELALIKACRNVFPDAKQLLCRWHINQSVWKRACKTIKRADYRNYFYIRWTSLVSSQTEEEYNFNLTQLQIILLEYPGVRDYLNEIWLDPYKQMFISAWTDKILHYGSNTTNRVESQHAKLKLYLDSPQSDLWKCASVVHNVIQSQVTAIKATFQYSKKIIHHPARPDHFKLLRNCVSLHALDMICDEFERCKLDSLICGCKLRTCYGLPCAHEQIMYFNAKQYLPLASVDSFWRKLDLKWPEEMEVDDDIRCDDEVQMITENFEKQPRSKRYNIVRRLREFIDQTRTSVLEPVVHKTTRGRPSLKKKPSKNNRVDAPIEDLRRRSCSNTSEIGLNSTNTQPPRHSSYVEKENYSYLYMNEFPNVIHPYIKQVIDVKGDGHCGFRAIASCLGFHQDEWYKVRADLIEELESHHTEYVDMFGAEYRFQLYNTLNFFGEWAPTEYYMTMPDTGILIASKYNVVLHCFSRGQNTTYLPLRSIPPPIQERVAIAIGNVGRHYVRIDLEGEYPVPPLAPQWVHCKRPYAAEWVTPYIERLNMYDHYYRCGFNV